MFSEHLGAWTTRALDAVSYGVAFSTIIQLLPPVAALLSIIWTAIQIWESGPVQRLRERIFGGPTS